MMGKYNWKDEYYDYNGTTITSAFYYSLIGSGNEYTRNKPGAIKHSLPLVNNFSILSSGYFERNFSKPGHLSAHIVGNGIDNTFIKGTLAISYPESLSIRDVTIEKGTITNTAYNSGTSLKFCKVKESTNFKDVSNCIITVNNYTGENNTYIDVKGTTLRNAQLNLFDNCDVLITATEVNSHKDIYFSFNNCRLKIGNETEYTALIGTSEEELRADFVDRCTTQGITVSDAKDYGETLKQGRWIFSNDSCLGGEVLKDSVIHNFEKRRFVYFGYSPVRGKKIAITTAANVPASFSPVNPNDKVTVSDNSIALIKTVDITDKNKAYIDSKIIWLGGKQQVNHLNITNTLPVGYGVCVDGTPSLSENPIASGSIVADKTYIVRSSDKKYAELKYNTVNYNTSLNEKNYVFRGVAGQTGFSVVSGNPAIYEILDEVLHKTIQIRITTKIPSEIIKTGNLLANYWYLVEHDTDQTNTTDYITYKGLNYSVGDSFLVSDTLVFSKSGNIHLRRCWKNDFDYNTEATDKLFWASEQKPEWIDILPDDPRCLMRNNNQKENEMQRDAEGKYITSGHPDFYNSILGTNGKKLPAFPIQGTYLQIRLTLTTLNPM